MALYSDSELYNKIKGCWLGKSIGGTLGMPYEGKDGPFNLSYYDPCPNGVMPNDDLDLQILWACVLNEMKNPEVNREVFAKAWVANVKFPFDEYAIAVKNLTLGLKPPLTGQYDNWFTCGMGALIRSEIWACLAPGNPNVAAKYAYEDACVDHAGDGIWAEVFMAVLESMAFQNKDINTFISLALEYIPSNSLLKEAISDTCKWWHEEQAWLRVRTKILSKYENENWSDVTMNVAFIILALLDGKGNFGRSICTAVNCGKDTDCTAATVGSLMGLMDPACIDSRWLEPIGENILLSPEIIGISPPTTIDEFTCMVLDLHKRLNYKVVEVPHVEQSLNQYAIKAGIAFRPIAANFWVDTVPKWPYYRSISLPGTLVNMPASKFEDDLMFLKYDIKIRRNGLYRVMFNTKANCRIWIDSKYAFGRECGRMAPSPHRSVLNQYTDIFFSEGVHEIVVIVHRPKHENNIEWQIGVADQSTKIWVPEVFYYEDISSNQ
ncbi:MAG: hypothetical protein A2Y12_14195 [Planctomycetes bacterium GWF2_42_9]|nr:MAG: hypothetical protein A2Y12_14195 [Planctomycetes bacterium GWF2_42_9]